MQGIYQIRNNINGKIYIGQSSNVEQRWYAHKSDLRRGKHRNSYLQRSWDKYGENNFVFEIIEEIQNEKRLTVREQHYADIFNPEYNLGKYMDSPRRGVKVSDETRRKLSKATAGKRNPMYGKKRTKEVREKISKALSGENGSFYGKKHTKDAKEKISRANKGENNAMWGKPVSKKTRKKISKALKGRKFSEEHKRKIAEAHYGITPSEETRQKLSKANSGKNSYWWGRKHKEESKRKIGEAQLGEKNHASKLTKELVLQMRNMYVTEEYSQAKIVEILNLDVNSGTAGKIIRGEAWKHVGGPIKGVDY